MVRDAAIANRLDHIALSASFLQALKGLFSAALSVMGNAMCKGVTYVGSVVSGLRRAQRYP